MNEEFKVEPITDVWAATKISQDYPEAAGTHEGKSLYWTGWKPAQDVPYLMGQWYTMNPYHQLSVKCDFVNDPNARTSKGRISLIEAGRKQFIRMIS